MALALGLVVTGCATTGGGGQLNDPPLQMEIKVGGLKQAERDMMKEQVCGLEAVSKCELVHDRGGTTLTFTYGGSLSALRYAISNFEHPGLEANQAVASLVYNGFDNLAPTIKSMQPNPKKVLTYKDVLFSVHIPDKDVVSVTMDGTKAKRVRGSNDEDVAPAPTPAKKKKGKKAKKKAPPPATKEADRSGDYQRTIQLKEGENAVEVVAKDGTGNESKLVMRVTVDTTPPVMEITMTSTGKRKALIKGKVEKGAKVSVDGKILDISFFGDFSLEVVGDPDKKNVTIIAVDEHGNEIREKRRIKDGSLIK